MAKGPWKWTYNLQDLADALGMDEREVRAAKLRGEFDPANLRSVLAWTFRQQVARAAAALLRA